MKYIAYSPVQAKQLLETIWRDIVKPGTFAGNKLSIEVKEATRSTAQNALMWTLLTEISDQMVWYGQKLTPDEFKDILSASLRKQKVVPGLDKNFVVCGQRTSRMTVKEMAELIELAQAFGAQQGVKFSAMEPA